MSLIDRLIATVPDESREKKLNKVILEELFRWQRLHLHPLSIVECSNVITGFLLDQEAPSTPPVKTVSAVNKTPQPWFDYLLELVNQGDFSTATNLLRGRELTEEQRDELRRSLPEPKGDPLFLLWNEIDFAVERGK